MKLTLKIMFRFTIPLATLVFMSACAHTITINPAIATHAETNLNPKKVAYVMTDASRNKQVTTAGGGGDKVTYSPYRDLEKMIRETLRAIYSDVSVIQSTSDTETMKANNIALVFVPEIITFSSSDSAFTWPPTKFSIEINCNVTDTNGNVITSLKATGNGFAEFSEFKNDFGLAGRRAASDVSEKLKQKIASHKNLN